MNFLEISFKILKINTIFICKLITEKSTKNILKKIEF